MARGIGYLELALAVEQDVVQFDVSMQDALTVAVIKSIEQLLQQTLGHALLQTSPFADIRKQVAAHTQLLHV